VAPPATTSGLPTQFRRRFETNPRSSRSGATRRTQVSWRRPIATIKQFLRNEPESLGEQRSRPLNIFYETNPRALQNTDCGHVAFSTKRTRDRVRIPISVAFDTIHAGICEILTPAYCQRHSVAHNGGVAYRVQRARTSRGETVLAHEITSEIASVSPRSKNR
jgi:hypothetical protein